MASTDWANPSSESTDWTPTSINSTDYASVATNSTNWGNSPVFTDFYLLLQNGTDGLLYQDDATFIGIQ